MALSAFPFETQDTSETQYSYIMRELQEPGVIGEPGDTNLKVIPGTGLQVKVQPGRGWARGFMLSSTADEPLTIGAPPAATRVDRVVVRVDPTANTVSLAVLPGTSGSAAPAALTQTDSGIFEFALARVTVVPGASTLATSDIVDERPRLSARVGRWSTDLRPPVPGVPSLGWNSTTNAFEFYNGSTWANLVPTWSTLAGKPSFSTLDGRTIFVNDLAPTAGQGANGDIWLEY